MAFFFNNTRLQPSGLACELVVPPEWLGEIAEDSLRSQFARTPYAVAFRRNDATFILVTLHVEYWESSQDRIPELKGIARWMADWARREKQWGHNFIVLGDFNIDRRDDNPLFNAFISTGLNVHQQLVNVQSSLGSEARFYDQIGWFMDDSFNLNYNDRAGPVDFSRGVFKDLSSFLMSFRVSDHFPLWVEFGIDRSVEQMGRALGLSEAEPIAGAKTFSTPIAVGSGGTGLSSTPTNGQILIGNGTGYVLATITGTTNQLTVTGGAGTITLSLPQDIDSGSSPTFTGLTLSGLTAYPDSWRPTARRRSPPSPPPQTDRS